MKRCFRHMTIFVFLCLFMATCFWHHEAHAQDQTLTPEQQHAHDVATAAAKAADAASVHGPATIRLLDEAELDLPAGYYFVPQKESAAVLDAIGHHNSHVVGMIGSPSDDEHWFIVIQYIPSGYVKDDDAKNWKPDEMLKNMQKATLEGNKDRTTKGYPAIEVAGWVETPQYDAPTHRLVWSALVERLNAQDTNPSVNYNISLLSQR